MSDTPFGFGLPPEEPDDGDEGKKKDQQSGGGQGPANPFGFGPGGPGGDNPLAAMFGSLNPNDLGAAFQQLGQMLSYEGGPVNWDMAKQIARQTVSQGTPDGTKDASIGPAERTAGRRGGAPGRPVAGRRDVAAVRRRIRGGLEPRGVGRGDPAGVEGARRPGRRAGRRGHGRRTARGDAGHGGPAPRDDALHGRRHVRLRRSGRPSACSRARSSARPTSACRSARSARPRCCR